MEQNDIQNLIDNSISQVTDFSYRKIGDTPTDMKQLTPKGYVDKAIASVTSSIPTSSPTSSVLSVSAFVAGENLAQGDAVAIGSGNGYLILSQTFKAQTNSFSTTRWLSQMFTTSADAISIQKTDLNMVSGGGILTLDLLVSIRADSAGVPTGADLGSINVNTTISNAGDNIVTFTFSSPIVVTASTPYHIVLRVGASGGSPMTWYGDTSGTGGNVSTNSGSTWGSDNSPKWCKVYEINALAGLLYKTSATVTSDKVTNFIGFTQSSILSSVAGAVTIDGVAQVPSVISAGTTYFLSNTSGQISSVTGTVNKKIGLGLSGSSLLIKHDN